MGWYYSNGCLCHMMLDGFAGGGDFLPRMKENYELIDARFKPAGTPHASHAEGRALVSLLVALELYMFVPLCVACYVGIALRRPWNHSLQLITLVCQFFGSLCFYIPEFMTSCVNLAPQPEPTCAPPLTFYNVLYFYFGTGVGFVWIVAPFCMIWVVVRQIAALVAPALAQASKTALTPFKDADADVQCMKEAATIDAKEPDCPLTLPHCMEDGISF